MVQVFLEAGNLSVSLRFLSVKEKTEDHSRNVKIINSIDALTTLQNTCLFLGCFSQTEF